jgi:hypothetical protein
MPQVEIDGGTPGKIRSLRENIALEQMNESNPIFWGEGSSLISTHNPNIAQISKSTQTQFFAPRSFPPPVEAL